MKTKTVREILIVLHGTSLADDGFKETITNLRKMNSRTTGNDQYKISGNVNEKANKTPI